MTHVGDVYECDLHDVVGAERYYIMAHDKGYKESTYKLGLLYINHDDIQDNVEKAKVVFQCAIDRNYPLGHIYVHGYIM